MDNDLLQEMTYLSRLVGKNEKAEHSTKTQNRPVYFNRNYINTKSGGERKPDQQRMPAVGGHIRENDFLLSTGVERSKVSSRLYGNSVESIPLPANPCKHSVYINKRMLVPKPESNGAIEPSVKSEKGVIYYNPKFMYGRLPVKTETENHKIHLNPKFLGKTAVGVPAPQNSICVGKKERVYVNPMFLNKSVNSYPIYNTPVSTAVEPDPVFPRLDELGSGAAVELPKPNFPIEVQTVRTNKYKLVNRRKRKSSLCTGAKVETPQFRKTKYSLRRRKSVGNVEEKARKTIKKQRSRSGSTSNPGLSATKRRKLSEDSDPFQRLGKMKLVRTSILQSQIVARRSSADPKHNYLKKRPKSNLNPPLGSARDLPSGTSKYKYVRKRLNSESKKGQASNRPEGKRRSVVKSRYKIVSQGTMKPTVDKKTKKTPGLRFSGLVNIEGVIYKSTNHKLTKKNYPKVGSVIRVRGVKFRLDNSGRTLKRLDKGQESSNKIERIDIGGVTFRPSLAENNVLLKSDTHTSRTILRSAKRKSIAILTAKLRKHNEPCTFFVRFGYCKGVESEKCRKLHDRKFVTLCKQYLRGKCMNKECRLSHRPIPEKMPLCEHYLAGLCLSDSCPYLHINHGSNTPLCRLFLRGYCPKAADCTKRHEFVCPVLAGKGSCPKMSRCPYPHPKKYRAEKRRAPFTAPQPLEKTPGKKTEAEVSSQRYFRMDLNLSDLSQGVVGEDSTVSVDCEEDDSSDDMSPKRKNPFPKLPEFLPLS